MELINNEKTKRFYREIIDDGNNVQFEELVDENGLSRIIINKNNVIRVILLYNQYVYNDTLNDIRTSQDNLGFGKRYVSVDKEYYDDGQKQLSEYLRLKTNFYSDSGEIFNDEFPTNQEIMEFLNCKKLLENVDNSKKSYIKKPIF